MHQKEEDVHKFFSIPSAPTKNPESAPIQSLSCKQNDILKIETSHLDLTPVKKPMICDN